MSSAYHLGTFYEEFFKCTLEVISRSHYVKVDSTVEIMIVRFIDVLFPGAIAVSTSSHTQSP